MTFEIGNINIDASFTVYTNIVDVKEKWRKLHSGALPFSFPSGITGYRLAHVPSTSSTSLFTDPVSFIEFTTGDGNWVTADPDWYNNKKLVSQMTINNVEALAVEDDFKVDEYVKYQSCLWKKFKKLGVVVEKKTPHPDHSYVFIGKDLAKLKKKWINDLKAVQISPSVYKLVVKRDETVFGYIIYWTGQCLGFDPREWHSDGGHYDQYMINVGDKYIFGGDQEYYYWSDYVNGKLDDEKMYKIKDTNERAITWMERARILGTWMFTRMFT